MNEWQLWASPPDDSSRPRSRRPHFIAFFAGTILPGQTQVSCAWLCEAPRALPPRRPLGNRGYVFQTIRRTSAVSARSGGSSAAPPAPFSPSSPATGRGRAPRGCPAGGGARARLPAAARRVRQGPGPPRSGELTRMRNLGEVLWSRPELVRSLPPPWPEAR